jgi:hypothetical protein
MKNGQNCIYFVSKTNFDLNLSINYGNNYITPIPVAERSKTWVCSRSPAGIADSNPAGGMAVCVFVR